MSRLPNFLRPNDKVALCSSARKISRRELNYAIELLKSKGLEVVLGDTIELENNQFAGSDKERAKDIQQMLDREDIKAIIFARGGYGTVRILDLLDFSEFEKHPKWLIGYSDVTAMLSHLYFNHGICSMHASMPIDLKEGKDSGGCFEMMIDSLLGKAEMNLCFGKMDSSFSKTDSRVKDIEFGGEMIGGNLSVLYSLLGSNSFGKTDGKILFIEDLDEYLYHIDRMMQALKRAGKLANLSGIVVGSFSQMHDNSIAFGQSAYEIIASAVECYDYPKVFGANIGHESGKNAPIVVGGNAIVSVKDGMIYIKQR
ncbi:MAG: LD-carboxypeptidase [Bacteroidales bacterium]|nr:LD-carboxypeptidase [Bacteroidales bacterium]